MPLPLLPLIPILASLVPDAVKWIAGDSAGKAAEKVASIATEFFGTNDPQAIEQAIAADPNLALQFKMAVLAAQAASEKEETARMMAHLADVQSARNQTVELAKTGSAIAWSAPIVSVLAVCVFGGAVAGIFLVKGVAPEFKDILLIFAGAAVSGYNQVLNYFLGSSAGSANKDRTLAEAVRK